MGGIKEFSIQALHHVFKMWSSGSKCEGRRHDLGGAHDLVRGFGGEFFLSIIASMCVFNAFWMHFEH